MSSLKLSVDDPEFVEKIIYEVKAQGHFDLFRKSCLADVDTQPAYQNLHSRVEDSVQKFLNRQVWTPETNKIKLREEMRYSIVRAGFLESGVSRIVDQVMEQKMESIQLKVEEILYKYVGIEKPEKHNGSLEIDTDLLPTELEQISPDSDKKSSMSEVKDEQIEEEIVEDEDFESPAFEPVEPAMDKNENSNLSAISGLTSQDSVEEKSEIDIQQESQLSQFSSSQEEEPVPLPPGEEPPLPFEEPSPPSVEPPPPTEEPLSPAGEPLPPTEEPLPPGEEPLPPGEEPIPPAEEPLPQTEEPPPPTEEPPTPTEELPPPPPAEEPEKSQFDLSLAGSIEFTGTKRKSLSLDDSSEAEKEKILQPHDVPSNTMEIDNLYENDTTDSSEMRMEIDLKADDTAESSKVEESSQDSTVSKEKDKDKHRHHHKSSSSRDRHHHKSSRHHHSSSKSRYDDKHRRSSGKHKRTSGDKEKSSGDKEKTSGDKEKDRSSSSHKDRKSSSSKHQKDDHYQEKSASRKRRSTDRDSNEGKDEPSKSSEATTSTSKTEENSEKLLEKKPVIIDSMLSENMEISIDSKSAKKEKSSILVKYDYLKSKSKEEIDDGFCGFVDSPHKLPDNPWFECLRKEAGKDQKKSLEQKKTDGSMNLQLPRAKKQKSKSPESPTTLTNGTEETTPEVRAQNIAQQQRYTDEDLYKPRFDFGNRSRRRGQITEDNVTNTSIESKQ